MSKTWEEISFEKLTFLYLSPKPGANGGLRNTLKALRGLMRGAVTRPKRPGDTGRAVGYPGRTYISKFSDTGNSQVFVFVELSLQSSRIRELSAS